MRFHPTRGAMSMKKSQGGTAPDNLCQEEDVILADMERLIQEFHDPSRYLPARMQMQNLHGPRLTGKQQLQINNRFGRNE